MLRFLVLICLAVVALPQPNAYAQVPVGGLDRRWTACQQDTDCAVVGAECGSPMASNRSFTTEYRSVMEKSGELETNCKPMPPTMQNLMHGAQAYCSNGMCSANVPNTPQDVTWHACRTVADCTHIFDQCGMPVAVNRLHAPDQVNYIKFIMSFDKFPACTPLPQNFVQSLNAMVDSCTNFVCTFAIPTR